MCANNSSANHSKSLTSPSVTGQIGVPSISNAIEASVVHGTPSEVSCQSISKRICALIYRTSARPAEQLTIEHYNRFPRLGKGPEMSLAGPTRPTWALQQVVGYMGCTGRGPNALTTAALDPKRRFATDNWCIVKGSFAFDVGCLRQRRRRVLVPHLNPPRANLSGTAHLAAQRTGKQPPPKSSPITNPGFSPSGTGC